jgi:hypothetical protein
VSCHASRANRTSRAVIGRWRKRKAPLQRYSCLACRRNNNDKVRHFTVWSGTALQDLRLSPRQIVRGLYHCVTACNGVSGLQLSKNMGCTQESAWFFILRLGHALRNTPEDGMLRGIVEVDDARFEGKNKWRRKGQKIAASFSGIRKLVLVMLQREADGQEKIIRPVLLNSAAPKKLPEVIAHVSRDAEVCTDEDSEYRGLNNHYKNHHTVNHSVAEYSRARRSNGRVIFETTNGAESTIARLKHRLRANKGVTAELFHFYIEWCSAMLNQGDVRRHLCDRMDLLISRALRKSEPLPRKKIRALKAREKNTAAMKRGREEYHKQFISRKRWKRSAKRKELR